MVTVRFIFQVENSSKVSLLKAKLQVQAGSFSIAVPTMREISMTIKLVEKGNIYQNRLFFRVYGKTQNLASVYTIWEMV
jgi:hypothetical protein